MGIKDKVAFVGYPSGHGSEAMSLPMALTSLGFHYFSLGAGDS